MMLRTTAKKVESLIMRLGRPLVHRAVETGGTFYNTTVTSTDTVVVGVVFDFRLSEIDNSVIQRHDKEILVSAAGVSIKKGDTIVDGGVEYSAINIEEVQLGPEKIMYIIQGRA